MEDVQGGTNSSLRHERGKKKNLIFLRQDEVLGKRKIEGREERTAEKQFYHSCPWRGEVKANFLGRKNDLGGNEPMSRSRQDKGERKGGDRNLRCSG